MKISLFLAAKVVALLGAASTPLPPMHMSFANMEASTVMKVIASQTGASIVFVGKDVPRISLDITVDCPEDAVRAAVSAAGMSYRKVHGAYIVASSDAMKHALEPYSTKVQYPLEPGIAGLIVKPVQEAYPDATVAASGDTLVFTGISEEVKESSGLVQELRLRTLQEAQQTELLSLGHSNPTDVSKAVTGLWPDVKVSSAGDDKSGVLSFSGPKRDVDAAMEFASKVDVLTQGRPESTFRVYEIKYVSASKLEKFMKGAMKDVETFIAPETYSPKRALFDPLTSAITGNTAGGSSSNGLGASIGESGQGTTGATGGSANGNSQVNQEEPDSRATRLVLHGLPDQLDAAVRLLESVDIKPQQVYVEVKVVETSPSFEANEGFTWSWSPLQFLEAKPGSTIANTGTYSQGMALGQFSRAPLNFTSLLNAQITSGEAKVLASPKLGVTDNDGASIFIGDTVNVPTSSSSLAGTTTSYVSFPVGIILLIHPRINSDGNITMHVNPVISTITGLSGGFPQTSSREAETTMIVKDGETIVLGGLLQDTFTKTVTAVPFLSKLPIIGELFRNSSTNKSRTDVIITITTHIIKEPTTTK